MTRYETYAPTGVAWLGDIPANWGCKKIGALFSERKTKVSDKDYAPLSVAKIGVVSQLATVAKTDAGDSRKLVCVGDFVINSRSDRKGSCGISELDGSVSLINIVLTPRQEWNRRYVHYLLRSPIFSEEYYRYGRGIVADLWTTRFSEMKNILLPVPPREEQDQIVRYLDWQVSKINQLIAVKKREISELENLKYTMVSNTVICGVNGTEEMSWERVRIGHSSWIRARLGWKGLKATEYVDEGYPFLSAFNIVNNRLSWENLNYINQKRYDESPEIKLAVGDILLVKDGAGIGKCARIDDLPLGESTPNGSLAVITPNECLNYKYLYYYFVSNDFRNEMFKIITGMGVPHLTQHFLKNVEIPCPPIDVQCSIAEYLDLVCGQIDDLINNKKSSIDCFHEFRTKLISDVVTGRIDIRGIEVPDFEYVEETLDEVDDGNFSDEEADA